MSEHKSLPRLDDLLRDDSQLMAHLEVLEEILRTPPVNSEAVKLLHDFADCAASGKSALISLHDMPVPGAERPIRLLLHPAVFYPEHWGRTFAEGLLKTPEIFDRKRVVELGCGSGWISLLLLLRTNVQEIRGLDINPVAVLLANLNAWLNGTQPDGTTLLSKFGLPIPLSFKACESDLLEWSISRAETFDHVIGCIPQVLHPDPEQLGRGQERLSDRDLYDLSNYCFQQGILEDRFGLPLIARSLEQSQICLKEGGRVTLILGGRPGPAAIDSMFRRRGFDPALIWSRRIQQADDTDLASLVALERQHGIEFNFFLSRDSHLPVSASTAVRTIDCGQPVYHDLLVYQAATRWEKPTLGWLKNLHELGLDSLRLELDLSRVSEEQISYLERLSRELLNSKAIPYPHERGDLGLRKRLARFLYVYCHYRVDPQRLFVGPDRAQLLELILSMVAAPGGRVLVSRSLLPVYDHIFAQHGLDVVVGNDDLSELMALDDLLNPALVLIAPHQLDNPSPIVLSALSAQANMHVDRWYLIDDSKHFDIGSQLGSNAFTRLASQQDLPGNLALLYGLIKNTVFPDLELSFLLNAPQQWDEGLDVGAELTYSRIARTTELYYEWLFDELLEFAFPDMDTVTPAGKSATVPELVQSLAGVTSDPVFAAKPVSLDTEGLIRLDYGEFEAPVPDLLLKGLVKGFLEAPVDGLPQLVNDRIAAYMRATRSVSVEPDRVVLGQGVYPILGALVRFLRERLGRAPIVALPDGTYGPCYPLVTYHGGQVTRIATDHANGFMLKMDALSSLDVKPDLLWLTQPNNPSGLMYEPDAVSALLSLCADRQIYLLADEVFFLLSDTRLGKCTPPELSFGHHLSSEQCKWLFVSDGVSKAFAAGGLRAGFMIAPDADVARRLQALCPLPPKSTLRAWDALYSAFLEEAPHQLMDIGKEKEEIYAYLESARGDLCSQRDALLAVLKRHGLDDGLSTRYRGGLFLLARLGEHQEALATEAGLLVNPPAWSRTDGWTRLCFSLAPSRFNEALSRLEKFLADRLG